MPTITLSDEQIRMLGERSMAVKFVDSDGNAVGEYLRLATRPIEPDPHPVTKEELDHISRHGKTYTSEEVMAMLRSHMK